tara:strand:- start:379 stop:597 length:219 start_codon:yes stop_codon:yes gene_type:complete
MRLKTEETNLGRVPVGSIIIYEKRVWITVNKIDGMKQMLVTNIGDGNRESILLASSTEVCYIKDVIKITEEA